MLRDLFVFVSSRVYTIFARRGFKDFGKNTHFRAMADMIEGKEHISIGDNSYFGKNIQITAFSSNNGKGFTPSIKIGSNCTFGNYNHITAINSIEIGDGVLTGKFVTITDNSHGTPGLLEEMETPPAKRPAFSKGRVVIGQNVWIGDKATILPDVTIGEGCIIGANAVVTKNVPPFCVVGGNPAKIIKQMNRNIL